MSSISSITNDRSVPVLFLAGGKATRLKQLGFNELKPLLPIFGIPIAFQTISMFNNHPIFDECSFITRSEYVTDFLKKGIHNVCIESDDFIGTGAWITDFMNFDIDINNGIVVMNGDLLISEHVVDILENAIQRTNHSSSFIIGLQPFLEESNSTIERTCSCFFDSKKISSFGTVRFEEEDLFAEHASIMPVMQGNTNHSLHRVTNFCEKGMCTETNTNTRESLASSNPTINSGIYYFCKRDLDIMVEISKKIDISNANHISIEYDIFPELVNRGILNVVCGFRGPWADFGTLDGIMDCIRIVLYCKDESVKHYYPDNIDFSVQSDLDQLLQHDYGGHTEFCPCEDFPVISKLVKYCQDRNGDLL